MNHARLSQSPRLQSALNALRAAHGPLSTLQLMQRAGICAVNSVIAELRENGCDITCHQEVQDGRRTFFYTLISEGTAS